MQDQEVGSAVIRLDHFEGSHTAGTRKEDDEKLMFRIIRASFNRGEEEKRLQNGMKNSLSWIMQRNRLKRR